MAGRKRGRIRPNRCGLELGTILDKFKGDFGSDLGSPGPIKLWNFFLWGPRNFNRVQNRSEMCPKSSPIVLKSIRNQIGSDRGDENYKSASGYKNVEQQSQSIPTEAADCVTLAGTARRISKIRLPRGNSCEPSSLRARKHPSRNAAFF